MQLFLIVLFLFIVLGLFSEHVQTGLGAFFAQRRRAIWFVPALLALLFAVALAASGAWSFQFLALVAAYVTLPVLLVWRAPAGQRSWLEFAAMLALWLPVEFTAGRDLLPRGAWNVANLCARGIAITLALAVFLVFRKLPGMRYNAPRRWTDLVWLVGGFAVLAAVLGPLGMWLGFLGPLRPSPYGAGGFAWLWTRTALGVALPEEVLFRSLIQNWLMQRFGASHATLAIAALIFGASHLNNPPGPLPNWHYMLMASVAGYAFGLVFWKSSSVWASAGLHALVNSTRHAFFL